MAGSDEAAGGDHHLTDTNNNTSGGGGGRGEKYALRPRTLIKRLQQEVRQDIPKRQPVKSKTRPPPLSKYRRKTANARERLRMREINNAFESLRRVLPEGEEVQVQASSTSAVTKIMTLRLAVEYIKALSVVLEDDTDQPFGPLGGSLHSCLHHSLPLSLHHHLQPARGTAATHNAHPHPQPLPLHHHHHHRPPTQLVGHYGACNTLSTSSSPATGRTSLSSTSDLDELFSDDSGLLEDTFDVFHELQTLAATDPFDILLGGDKDAALAFPAELCN